MTEQIPEDTSDLGSMTVEDDITTDPAERAGDLTQTVGDSTGLGAEDLGAEDLAAGGQQADDLQADEASDPSAGAGGPA